MHAACDSWPPRTGVHLTFELHDRIGEVLERLGRIEARLDSSGR